MLVLQIMDGFETARLVRKKDCISHAIPIVALTAATSEGEVEKCIASGMDDYISKPVTKGILQRALERWLGKESRWV
jgi:two-component system sensor histidine kinase/response regulator